MASFRKRLSDILIEQQLATSAQLDAVSKESSKKGQNFARTLIEQGIVSEAKLTELLSQELGLPMISLTKYRLDASVVKMIPERVARQYNMIPLAKFGERLVVAMADPLDVLAIDDLKALTQIAIDPVLSSESEIRRAIDKIYSNQVQLADKPTEVSTSAADNLDSTVALIINENAKDEDAPVVQAINLIVGEAMKRNASDIHLEPMYSSLRVRYRVDGGLIETHQLPKAVQSPLLTRIKIMAGCDITEWRLPQDGRFKVRLGEREVDFRVSILPIAHGGKVVLRLLDKKNLSVGLDNLGFLSESIEQFKVAVKRPFGMILVTGPTGSGKSTTLYSILNSLNQPVRNIITVEDPVEYQVEGITQVQVNPDVGLDFARGLRSILRQSPDVVMIGEIRDFETADIAMKASLTGQLVLSTLHTNDAASAVTRLVDMGVEPFLVASSLSLIEAQRLVRKLCLKCRKEFDPQASLLKQLDYKPDKKATFYKAVGCRRCNSTGYKGRMGIIEVFTIDEEIREMVVSKAQSWEIRKHAIEKLGMLPMRDDGLRKAEMGVTTLEDVFAVTSEE